MNQFPAGGLQRIRGGVLASLLGIVALAGGGAGYMMKMPGQNFNGPAPLPSTDETVLARQLRRHVSNSWHAKSAIPRIRPSLRMRRATSKPQ